MSTIGRFVPGHVRQAFSPTGAARDRLIVRSTAEWPGLAICQGLTPELELVFSYDSSAFLDPMSAYWVCAITERVLRAVAMMMYEAYDLYRLWYLPPDIIMFARRLGFGMSRSLGAPECERGNGYVGCFR